MALETYREKRDFSKTSEPRGHQRKTTAHNSFVIQKHDATRLHYDFRLEVDGVLKSWAVPKGFPFQKGEKHLAVHVEDHPIEYGDFEGIIPPGNYGAGAMIVWDRGTYTLVDGLDPNRALESGKLDLLLRGHKLNGRWALIRTKGGEANEWLLISKNTPTATEPVIASPASILSGLTKGDLLSYYARISPKLLPHLKDRPVTVERLPDVVDVERRLRGHVLALPVREVVDDVHDVPARKQGLDDV